MASYVDKETGEIVDAEMFDGDSPITVKTKYSNSIAQPGDYIVLHRGLGYTSWPPGLFCMAFDKREAAEYANSVGDS